MAGQRAGNPCVPWVTDSRLAQQEQPVLQFSSCKIDNLSEKTNAVRRTLLVEPTNEKWRKRKRVRTGDEKRTDSGERDDNKTTVGEFVECVFGRNVCWASQ